MFLFAYLVYLPDGYCRSSGRWPLILTLHGRGEAGSDINLVRRQGLPLRVEARGGLPFVVVAPQCPDLGWNVGALGALLDEVLRRYRVDADRVYLVGNIMGGTGTWALAASCPERFAAIAPICGGGDPDSAGRLRDVPTWAFHGGDDRIVPLERSERMIAALRQAGGDARPIDGLPRRRPRCVDADLREPEVLRVAVAAQARRNTPRVFLGFVS
jgi:predicted peptidase